ncbi:hypothetical protein [Nostocoides veronense]|uniref:Uncharacterized protein n=1 Tax=Nostocoides veronense TaxID=330836 RepID=A0ABP4Y9F0_9MICO
MIVRSKRAAAIAAGVATLSLSGGITVTTNSAAAWANTPVVTAPSTKAVDASATDQDPDETGSGSDEGIGARVR